MKILVTGKGTSGSFKIRGVQLGAAIGADVVPMAEGAAGYDLAVVVKRPRMDFLQRCRVAKVPVVYDIVDAWTQPEGNHWGRDQALAWLTAQIRLIRPAAIVAATNRMARDCAEFGVPVLSLPHHHRPGIEGNPIREHVQTVAYEGGDYLGNWKPFLQAECDRRGWVFRVNPGSLAEADIVVGLREARGYPVLAWKSNVKLANAQGSGTPFIGNGEAGQTETACGAEIFATTQREVADAFDLLTPAEVRRSVSAKMRVAAPTIESIAAKYKEFLSHV